MSNPKQIFQGLRVELFRSKIDNQLVVDIDTTDIDNKADLYDSECAKFRIIINEAEYQVTKEEHIINIIIARLLGYTFDPIDWNFDKCTEKEKAIIGNQESLDEIKKLVDEEYRLSEIII